MAINIKRYVDITSGVAGAAAFGVRQLIGRIFSTNVLIPTGSYISFGSPQEVGTYFGTTSAEYLRAVFYFAWVSKLIKKARSISYARWVDAAVAPSIYGTTTAKALGTYTPITAGGFSLVINGVATAFTALDLSAAGTLAAVAAAVQTKIRTGAGAMFTTATVTFDIPTQRFILILGTTGAATITVTDGAQTPLAALGWTSAFPDTILSNGAAIQTIDDVLTASAVSSDAFGAFLFMPTLSLDQVTSAANWNDTQNVMFMFTQRVVAADRSTWNAALDDISGIGLTLAPLAAEYPEMVPMIILAATDWDRPGASQNYMYQTFNLTASVESDADANIYDALRINYYGVTQSNGTLRAFYQRGLLMGGLTDPVDMNVYANEMWLKSAITAGIINLLLAVSRVPANTQGRAMVLNRILPVIKAAIFNGVISVGKTLTPDQIASVTDITGSDKAWQQVQNQGWWLDVVIAPFVNDQTQQTEYKATYTLVYAKDDAVRKVIGSDVLV